MPNVPDSPRSAGVDGRADAARLLRLAEFFDADEQPPECGTVVADELRAIASRLRSSAPAPHPTPDGMTRSSVSDDGGRGLTMEEKEALGAVLGSPDMTVVTREERALAWKVYLRLAALSPAAPSETTRSPLPDQRDGA